MKCAGSCEGGLQDAVDLHCVLACVPEIVEVRHGQAFL